MDGWTDKLFLSKSFVSKRNVLFEIDGFDIKKYFIEDMRMLKENDMTDGQQTRLYTALPPRDTRLPDEHFIGLFIAGSAGKFFPTFI